jgi:hypothetical protein
MASVRRRDRPSTPQREEQLQGQPPRLPLRWAVIGILGLTAGIVGFVAGGPVAARRWRCCAARPPTSPQAWPAGSRHRARAPRPF